ncbi:MAG: glycosyltransferase [bacterium]
MADRSPSAAPSGSPPTFSLVIPCFEDADRLERNLPLAMNHLTHAGVDFEVVVVDDGSANPDRTAEVARTLGVRFASSPAHRGKGAAVRLGMQLATGRFRAFTDADVPFELDALDRLLWYLDFKEFHMVAGDRTLAESVCPVAQPWVRRLASATYSQIVGKLVATGWYDTQCGLKGFRAEVADDLFAVARIDGFAFDVELFYVALKRNYDIKRIPVRLRTSERSSVRLVRDGFDMLSDLPKLKLNHVLGRYAPRVPVAPSVQSAPREAEAWLRERQQLPR